MQSFSSMLAKGFSPTIDAREITSIVIGKFDGLHLGHRALLESIKDDECGAVVIVDKQYTSKTAQHDPQHSTNNHTTKPSGFLTSLHDRLKRLPNACVLAFDAIADMEASEFLQWLSQVMPSLKRIIVGYDFRFGSNRRYCAQDLLTLSDKQILIIPQVCHNNHAVHTSAIKERIRSGNIRDANAMLGWCYTISGAVIQGQGIGKKSLFPTINIQPDGYVLPADGVYATRINGAEAISFFGRRVSTDGAYAIESHIIDSTISTPPATMQIELYDFVRENRYFSSLDMLKAQIHNDIQTTKTILQTMK